jgi:nitroimidazol reductase NimA-like FMN-containing flavoprotein (pyridoxamine 5'-phosphate oxidase superfamily)
MVRVINADPQMGTSMTEHEAKEFMTKRTILHIGTIDNKGESNVTPVGYYFDSDSNKIYITTHKNSKKVRNLSNNKIVSFCIDDSNPPYKGVRGKGEVSIHEEIDYNRLIAEKLLMRSLGSLEHPTSKWLLGEIEKGNEIVLEISPRYYSTWNYGKTTQ